MSVELLSYKSPVEPLSVEIVTEQIDRVTVGRQILRVVSPLPSWEPNDSTTMLINLLNNRNNPYSETGRSRLRLSLNNNSANESKELKHERAVSAYFTYNPEDETVIIEWGTINPRTRDAKLHNDLNRMINYRDRSTRGMKASSGHLAKSKSGLYFALFDNLLYLSTQRIDPRSPMGKTINTLYANNNFVLITADGFVQLPAF